MLKIAYSRLLKSQIALSDLDKLMEALFFTAAAAWLRSRLALHGTLTGHRITGISLGTLTGSRRGRLVGRAGSARHHSQLLLAQELLVLAAPAQSC